MSVQRHWGLYSQLSGFYFIYFITAGAFVPYWPVYLHSLGYAPAQIGIALGTVGLARVVMPLVWGALGDRLGRRMQLIAGAMFMAALFIGSMPYASSFAALLLLHLGYAFFWNAAMPGFDVVTLGHVSARGLDYPRIRLWGSVGFIVAVVGLGPVLDRAGLAPVPWIMVGGLLVMASCGWLIPDGGALRAPAPAAAGEFLARARQPVVLALLASCFLTQVSFAPFYGFFSLFMSSHGYDNAVIGSLWGVGVVSEVGVLIFAGRLISHLGARAVFLLALASAALRWLAMALLIDNLPWLIVTQLLHLSSGGLYQAVTIHFVHRLFPEHMQGRAQALLMAASFGLGGAVGNYSSGLLWGADGAHVYLLAAGVATLAFAVAWRGVKGVMLLTAPADASPQTSLRN